MALIKTQNFFLIASMPDLVSWIGVEEDTCISNPDLRDALNKLDIQVNLVELYERFFSDIPVGKGDVYLFPSSNREGNFFAIDLYRGITDQMDIVNIGLRCRVELIPEIARSVRSFFDSASCQVHYEQASFCKSLNEMTDSERYPITIEETGYKQQLVVENG